MRGGTKGAQMLPLRTVERQREFRKKTIFPKAIKVDIKPLWKALRDPVWHAEQLEKGESSAYRENWKWEIATQKVPHTLHTYKKTNLKYVFCLSAPNPKRVMELYNCSEGFGVHQLQFTYSPSTDSISAFQHWQTAPIKHTLIQLYHRCLKHWTSSHTSTIQKICAQKAPAYKFLKHIRLRTEHVPSCWIPIKYFKSFYPKVAVGSSQEVWSAEQTLEKLSGRK